MKLQVVLEPSDEGGYTVYVPALPGCVSEGDTIDDAMRNIREAIELYLEPVEDDFAVGKDSLVRELALEDDTHQFNDPSAIISALKIPPVRLSLVNEYRTRCDQAVCR